MPTYLFDTHCHPQFAAYDADREEMIKRAIARGVSLIAVGTCCETSYGAAELARHYPGIIWAAIGIHPNHAAENPHDPLETINKVVEEKINENFYKLSGLPEVLAIGETGLDYHYLKPIPGSNHIAQIQHKQRNLFRAHIELAKSVKKPLIIHARDAYRDVFDILSDSSFQYGFCLHFFQGTPKEAEQFLELGGYISFAGPITFTEQYDETIRAVPLERLLIETDAPYAAPDPYRGKRNEPIFIEYVAAKIAKIKNLPPADIARISTENAKKLFNLL